MIFKILLHRIRKIVLALIAFLVFLVLTLSYVKNVSTELTPSDINHFQLLGIQRPSLDLSYKEEIDLIINAQRAVFLRAPLGQGIPNYEPREVENLFSYGKGLCFDRSRTFDKLYSYLGFESRHVFLLFKKNSSFLSAILSKHQPSHAVTEVKTSRGWLFIDSNETWIGVTRNGDPVDADDIWKRLDEFETIPYYLKDPSWAIRGLYSRSGGKYPPFFIRFPEISWQTLINWLIHG